MSKVTKTPSIDDIRALMASSTQVYWVCPVTQKRIPAGDSAAITAHQEKVIQEMEAKERSKLRQKVLRDLNAEVGRIASLDELRAWALRRVCLDVSTAVASDLPTFSVYVPKFEGNEVKSNDVYVRLSGGKALTEKVKAALNVKQGKALHRYQIGKGAESSWFMNVSSTSVLGKKMLVWINRKAKKLSEQENVALLAANPEHAKDVAELKALGLQIHALREQAAVLTKRCDATRSNALNVLPLDLS